ncbi:hypothetical protein ACQ88U_37870 [Streptomyces lividans]
MTNDHGPSPLGSGSPQRRPIYVDAEVARGSWPGFETLLGLVEDDDGPELAPAGA